MAELLTDEIIIEHLENNYGLQEEPDGPAILEILLNKYDGSLDTESSWAKGNEDRIQYYQSTADSYEVYITTESHDHKDIYFEQDVYYYLDHDQFSQDIIDVLLYGGSVWCDPNIWDDLEYEFNYQLVDWYNDFYMEKRDEAEEELLDSGDYYKEKED
jgi:hypothetical protein